MWRLVDDAWAWAGGAARFACTLNVDATITVDHFGNKENAAATWKRTFGFHALPVFLDRSDIAAGESLAGLLRPGNAGSNSAADQITVLGQALESLPPLYRPGPDNPGCASDFDPLRFGGRHLWVCGGLPRSRSGVFPGGRHRCRRVARDPAHPGQGRLSR
jgi:hypothetical protein